MNIKENSILMIEQVDNGFTIRGMYLEQYSRIPDVSMVFNSMTDLLDFITKHFSHRAKKLSQDGIDFDLKEMLENGEMV